MSSTTSANMATARRKSGSRVVVGMVGAVQGRTGTERWVIRTRFISLSSQAVLNVKHRFDTSGGGENSEDGNRSSGRVLANVRSSRHDQAVTLIGAPVPLTTNHCAPRT